MAGNNKVTKDDFLNWIHCNKCFESYSRKQRSLYLLACQHVACEGCLQSEDKEIGVCCVCGKTARMRELGNALPPHIKQLFHPNPWQDGLPIAHILRFQLLHRNNIKRELERVTNEHAKLQQSHTEARAKAKQQFEFLENSRHERKRLEERVRKVIKERQERQQQRRHMVVPPTPPSTTTDDSSIMSSIARRPRYPTSSLQQRPPFGNANPLALNGPRMIRPNSAPPPPHFSDFAYVDNSFTL